jgi:HEAT repeat protein
MTLDPQRALPVAQFMLSDADSRMRRTAAELLVKSGWAPAAPLEHAQLAIGLGKFSEAMWHGDEAVQLVLGFARDQDAGIRREVFKALGLSRDPQFIEILYAAAVTESEPLVQSAILQSLQELGVDVSASQPSTGLGAA